MRVFLQTVNFVLLLLLLLLVLLQTCTVILAADTERTDTDDICRFFSNNTQIRAPDSCNKYITCIDFVSHYTTCKLATPFYDKNTNKCVKELNDTSNCEISCVNQTGKFVLDPKSCKGYYYCQDETTAQPGTCPDTTHFNVTEQRCIYKYESKCSIDQFEFCSVIKNGVNFKDERNCAKYFVCTKGELKSKSCNGQYYDASTGKCVQKSQIECNEHPLPKDVCGTEKKPKHNVFVSDEATCNGYFYCGKPLNGGVDKKPTWDECPHDKFFNEKAQRCDEPTTIACKEDRCSGRTIPFVSSGRKGCRYYLRCIDGVTDEELSCGNSFFDEYKGACVSQVITYDSCKG